MLVLGDARMDRAEFEARLAQPRGEAREVAADLVDGGPEPAVAEHAAAQGEIRQFGGLEAVAALGFDERRAVLIVAPDARERRVSADRAEQRVVEHEHLVELLQRGLADALAEHLIGRAERLDLRDRPDRVGELADLLPLGRGRALATAVDDDELLGRGACGVQQSQRGLARAFVGFAQGNGNEATRHASAPSSRCA